MEQQSSPSQPWAAFKRRRLPALWTAAAVLVLSVLIAVLWPPRYSAIGTILIEQQELPSDLVRSTISSYASQRIQVISQRVMTTDNLMKIIDRYDLYASMRKRRAREEVVARMRRDCALQMISADVIDPRDGRPTKATIAFSISYNNGSAQVASKVANELVSLYLQQNIETRQKSSRDAAAFLGGESDRLTGEINALQANLAQYKEKHANELPDLAQLNIESKMRTDDEIRDTDSQLRSLAQQVVYLNAQLAQINPTAQIYASTGERVQSPEDRLKYVRTEYARLSAIYSADHPDVVRSKREMEGLEASTTVDPSAAENDYRRQLEDAKTQLASARQRYSADHPDVLRLQRMVESLQQKLQDQLTTPAGTVALVATGSNADRANSDNPAYIQVKAQLEASQNEMRSLQEKRVALLAKRDSYERRLAATPAVERDYIGIVRDLDSAQTQFREIRQKQMEAQIAENMEVERKGERFTLIEPPFTPEEPTSPNRPMIFLFGVMLALGAGLGTVALLESTDGSIRGRHDLQMLLTEPPLALIPVMLTSVDYASSYRRRTSAILGAACSVILAVVLVHFLYRPLDVLWSVALRRLGLGL